MSSIVELLVTRKKEFYECVNDPSFVAYQVLVQLPFLFVVLERFLS